MRLKDLNPGPFIVCFLVVASWMIVIYAVRGGMDLYAGLFGKEPVGFLNDAETVAVRTKSSEEHIASAIAGTTNGLSLLIENSAAQIAWSGDVEGAGFLNPNRSGRDVIGGFLQERSDGGVCREKSDEKSQLEKDKPSGPPKGSPRSNGLARKVVPLKKSRLVKNTRPTESDPLIEIPFLM